MTVDPCYFQCQLCPTQQTRLTEDEAKAAAAWHGYREHPEVWRQVIGNRPPRDPDPDKVAQN